MNTQEHLQRIKARCEQLLALAEKRTPGKWEAAGNVCFADDTDGYYHITCDGPKTRASTDVYNATFIASCAGPAEAGWRATIAAIDFLEELESSGFLARSGPFVTGFKESILAAWPEELLS